MGCLVILAAYLCISLTILSTDIVDKTASFVARNGPEFEARIRQNEIGNPKFNFLNFGDPYHAYYQYKVKDFREGRGEWSICINCTQTFTSITVTTVSHSNMVNRDILTLIRLLSRPRLYTSTLYEL